ncbi:MAG: putative TIM-barrel fold metal-dependent hydrolase [Lentimonas sp.]
MNIIDSHTHCYPPELAVDPRAWAAAKNEPHWADLVAPLGRPSIQGWATIAQTLTAMDAADVQQSVLLGWYWENEATCRWQNEVIAEWVNAAPERFIGFAAIHPGGSAESVIAQCEYALSLSLRGVGELHPGIQHFNSTSAGWLALADWCIAHNWPINCHATEAVGHDHPGSVPTPLNDFLRMAEAHPELKLILAHWGGGLAFFELNPRLRKALKNIYYDTSATPLLYEPSIFRRMIEIIGSEKILFGSDYPLRVYPRKKKTPDIATFLNAIQHEAELTDEEFETITHQNMRRLLGEM